MMILKILSSLRAWPFVPCPGTRHPMQVPFTHFEFPSHIFDACAYQHSRSATVYHLTRSSVSALALINSNSAPPAGGATSAWQNHGTCAVQLFQHRRSLKIRALATHAHSDHILLNQLVNARANLVPIIRPSSVPSSSSSSSSSSSVGASEPALPLASQTGTRAEDSSTSTGNDESSAILSFTWRNQDCADASAPTPAELTCAVTFRNPDGSVLL
jgi:hypothetical protein